jgi:hypothetical protein
MDIGSIIISSSVSWLSTSNWVQFDTIVTFAKYFYL